MFELASFLRSRAVQAAGVVLIAAVIGAQHWANDGLWLQGDAPRHAANGLFWWDLLRSGSSHPIDFAVRYYARYPIINPASYPPLFYILEGLAFAAIGPSPHVAKGLVLLFGVLGGLYTMAWARRWISPAAGWAGLFLGFVPGVVLWSNAVMLNVPAMSLSVGALYHFRRWLETTKLRDLGLSGLMLAMVLITYYPAAVVLGICLGWLLLQVRTFRWDRRVAWIAAGLAAAAVPVVISLWLAPVPHGPSFAKHRFPEQERNLDVLLAESPAPGRLVGARIGRGGLPDGRADRPVATRSSVPNRVDRHSHRRPVDLAGAGPPLRFAARTAVRPRGGSRRRLRHAVPCHGEARSCTSRCWRSG